MAISSHGTTFAFITNSISFAGRVTSISIEEAQPEVVDMTDIDDSLGVRRIMVTGDVLSSPTVAIEFIRLGLDLQEYPPGTSLEVIDSLEGTLIVACPGFTMNQPAVLNSASTDMAVGDVIRGKMSFTISRIN